MAFTPLTTQIAGTAASAPGWANVVKANFESMGPHLIVRKTADQADASTTPHNDDQLLAPVAANEVWLFQFYIWQLNTTSSDSEYGFTFPSGTVAGLMDTIGGSRQLSGTSSPFSATFINGFSTNAPGAVYPLQVVYACGGTGGNLQLQWATNGTGTLTVKANSTLWGVKLA